jgi:hypothetical protein
MLKNVTVLIGLFRIISNHIFKVISFEALVLIVELIPFPGY